MSNRILGDEVPRMGYCAPGGPSYEQGTRERRETERVG